MEYLYVLAAFLFVTAIAFYLKAKREKQAKEMRERDQAFMMEEQMKAAAEKAAKEKAGKP